MIMAAARARAKAKVVVERVVVERYVDLVVCVCCADSILRVCYGIISYLLFFHFSQGYNSKDSKSSKSSKENKSTKGKGGGGKGKGGRAKRAKGKGGGGKGKGRRGGGHRRNPKTHHRATANNVSEETP